MKKKKKENSLHIFMCPKVCQPGKTTGQTENKRQTLGWTIHLASGFIFLSLFFPSPLRLKIPPEFV